MNTPSQIYLLLKGASLEIGKTKGRGLGALYLFFFLCLTALLVSDILPIVRALIGL